MCTIFQVYARIYAAGTNEKDIFYKQQVLDGESNIDIWLKIDNFKTQISNNSTD